jgi:putative transposase
MPNPVHFIMTLGHEDGLRATFAEAHRRYSARIHARLKLTGHLWQGRFSSTAMDERHLRAHLTGKDDGVVVTAPSLARVPDFAGLLKAAEDEAATRALLNSRTTGRPVGAADWIQGLEAQMGRELAAGRRGPKPGATSPDALSDDLFHTVSP